MNSVLKLLLAFMMFSTFAFASIGSITASSGSVFAINKEGKKSPAIAGYKLEKEDTIVTEKDGKAQLKFNDKTVITLGINSNFKIEEYFEDAKAPKAKFKIGEGTFKALTGAMGKINPEGFKLETKTATIGIRGTGILGQITPAENKIACTAGAISVTSLDTGETVNVGAGQITSVAQGLPPTPPRAFTPTETQAIESEAGTNEMPDDTQTQQQDTGATGDAPAQEGEGEGTAEEGTAEEGGEQDAQAQDDTAGAEGAGEDDEDVVVAGAPTPPPSDTTPTTAALAGDNLGEMTTTQTDRFLEDVAETVGVNVNELVKAVDSGEGLIVTQNVDLSNIETPPQTQDSEVFNVDNFNRDVYYDGIIGYSLKRIQGMEGNNLYGQTSTTDGFHLLKYSLSGGGTITTFYNFQGVEESGAPSVTIDITGTMPALNSSSYYVGWARVYEDSANGINIYSDSKQEFIFWDQKTVSNISGYDYQTQKFAAIGDGTSVSVFDGANPNGIVEYQPIDGSSSVWVNMRNNNLLRFDMTSDARAEVIIGTRDDDGDLAGFYGDGMSLKTGQTRTIEAFSASVFGSEYQGLGGAVFENNNGYRSMEGIAAYRGYTQTSDTPTGTLGCDGFAAGFKYESGTYTPLSAGTTVALSINRETGDISGNFLNTINASGGTTSAYINDDLFAVTGFDGAISYLAANDPIANGGNDWITWGYWATDNGGIGYINGSMWIGGVVPSDIQTQITALAGSSTTYNYQGPIMGQVLDGGTIYKIDSGGIDIDIDFASASGIQAALNLTYNGGTTWSVTKSGVNQTLSGTTGAYSLDISDGTTSGQVNGRLYGPSLQQTGGVFNMSKDSGSKIATGIFRADKQ